MYNDYISKQPNPNGADLLLRPGRKLVKVNDIVVAELNFKEAIGQIKAQSRPMTLHFA